MKLVTIILSLSLIGLAFYCVSLIMPPEKVCPNGMVRMIDVEHNKICVVGSIPR